MGCWRRHGFLEEDGRGSCGPINRIWGKSPWGLVAKMVTKFRVPQGNRWSSVLLSASEEGLGVEFHVMYQAGGSNAAVSAVVRCCWHTAGWEPFSPVRLPALDVCHRHNQYKEQSWTGARSQPSSDNSNGEGHLHSVNRKTVPMPCEQKPGEALKRWPVRLWMHRASWERMASPGSLRPSSSCRLSRQP